MQQAPVTVLVVGEAQVKLQMATQEETQTVLVELVELGGLLSLRTTNLYKPLCPNSLTKLILFSPMWKIPYGGTFLTFSDYSRNAIRMAALMKLRVVPPDAERMRRHFLSMRQVICSDAPGSRRPRR